MEARLIRRILSAAGETIFQAGDAPAYEEEVVSEPTRRTLMQGMRAVVTRGTAASFFQFSRGGGRTPLQQIEGTPLPEGRRVRVYGKTGTLKTRSRPVAVFLFLVTVEHQGEIEGGLSGAVYLETQEGGPRAAVLGGEVIRKVLIPYLARRMEGASA